MHSVCNTTTALLFTVADIGTLAALQRQTPLPQRELLNDVMVRL